jgi:hypothetical protein
MFDQDVKPLLQQRCQTCHITGSIGPAFLGSGGVDGFYDSIAGYTSATACVNQEHCLITFADSSILSTKGVHSGGTEGWWQGTELDKVKAWLVQEVVERNITVPPDPCIGDPSRPECVGGMTGPTKPKTAEEALIRFGKCMTLDNWTRAATPPADPGGPGYDDGTLTNIQNIALANSQDGRCYNCHMVTDLGCAGGACLDSDTTKTFIAHQASPSILKLVLPVAGADGFADLIPANRYVDKGNEGGGIGSQSNHPRFELTVECTDALSNFVDETMARYHDYSDPCDDPPPPAP